MATVPRNNLLAWRFPILLVLVAAAVSFSWKYAGQDHPLPERSNMVEQFFPGYSLRAGATTDQTIHTLQDHLKDAPRDWAAYSRLGLAYLQKVRETGDPSYYPKIEQAFAKTLANNPGDYAALCGMGALTLARHQFQSALDWGERARNINPSNAYAYGIITDAHVELGQYPQAVETVQEMVDLRPDMSSYARVAYVRELFGEMDSAVEAMQMAADGGQPGKENTAWTRTQLGNLYFNLGDLRQAEFEYQLTLRNTPGYVYALAGLGHIRAAEGKYSEAAGYLTKASDKMPVPEFIIALGDVYEMSGQSEAARREVDLVRAIQKLYAANGVDMDLEIALFNADHAYNPSSAVEQARRVYKQRPSIYAADVLAWTLYQDGQYPQAARFSEEALRLGSHDALKQYHAGMIYLKLGDAEKARLHLEQALRTNPYFSIRYSRDAQRILTELKNAPAR